MRRRNLLPALLLLLLPLHGVADSGPVPPESENYCHDPETTATWERMFKDSPEDPIVVKLYSLRKGLCAMIDEGKISFECNLP